MNIVKHIGWLATVVFGAAVLHVAAPASAQDYPTGPIHLIVPYQPGGPTDSNARVINSKLGELLGQPVIVENRPGAGSVIGSATVAKAKPDGQTVLLFTAANTMNVSLVPDLPYDIIKDFAHVTMLARLPSLLVVHPSLPVNSAAELIAYAKANPGELSYASSGNGTPMHLAGELFKSMAGLDIVHIPYKGSASAVTDLVAGRVQMSIIGSGPGLLAQIKSGQLRALAIADLERSPLFPDLPTIHESGLPDFAAAGWHGLALPANTPEPIRQKLYSAVSEVLKDPETIKAMERNGATPGGMEPDQFASFIKSEIAKWSKVVKDANLAAK